MKVCGIVVALLEMVHWASGASNLTYVPSQVRPPAPMREFRGMWIATVKNIDWPSQPGLSPAQQKVQLLAILDRAVQLKLNAVILQVRPSCDALYPSTIEPWAEYLTGRMGVAPRPFYDPLEFAVQEAHRRGLELHAWFNPFRARHAAALSPVAPNHISRSRPQLVRTYAKSLWLDPGEKAARDYSLRVILDVVHRYDVDGVHLDDYFYPYPEKDAAGKVIEFPDGGSWRRYEAARGKLSREDWRRQNVDDFVERLYQAVKTEKPRVKVGISPFGIWRPGHPESVRGLDAYNQIFADSRKWFAQGWVDYLSPQLYWPIHSAEQSYPVLLKWWADQNGRHRHLWPGSDDTKIGGKWPVEEIVNQVRLSRRQPGVSGNLHWNATVLMQDRGGVCDALRNEVYAQPALVPASPWLDPQSPASPVLTAQIDLRTANLQMGWSSAGAEGAWLWLLQARFGGHWRSEILPGAQASRVFEANSPPDVVALSAIDRCGNASAPVVLEARLATEKQ